MIREIIESRRSVRTFREEKLSAEDRGLLEAYIKNVQNPFGKPVELRFLVVAEYGLQSPVIVGAKEYIAGKVHRDAMGNFAFGYSFEKLCLYAKSIGIGTVILAATLNRPVFETAMDVKDGEFLWAATPVGYIADQMSKMEAETRVRLKADERIPYGTMFYDKDSATPLQNDSEDLIRTALAMARLAPSARNYQPLRAVVDNNIVHFYAMKEVDFSRTIFYGAQQVDIGIAFSHFDLYLREQGWKGVLRFDDPQFSGPPELEYEFSAEIIQDDLHPLVAGLPLQEKE